MPTSRFLLEYKAARLVMQGGNIEQSELRGLIESDKAFFAKDETRDYERCNFSSPLIEEYPGAFLPVDGADLEREGAISAKAQSKGLISKSNAKFAPGPIRLAALAAREDLKCVLAPPTVIIDSFGILKAAAVPKVTVADFIQYLKDNAK